MANRTVAAQRPKSRGGKRPRPLVDEVDRRLEGAQRAVLTGTVVLAALALHRPLPDAFMVPKLTAIVVGTVLLLALAGLRALRTAQVTVPGGPLAWICLAFVAALVLATVTADNVALAFVGNNRRYGGLLSYLSYVLVFLVAVRLFSRGSVHTVVRALLVALAGVTLYGLIQHAGLDPVNWVTERGDKTIFSTLGNTNFAGAYVALVLPVAAAAVLLGGWSRGWRTAVAVGSLVAAVYMLTTAAAQAVLASAGGLAVVGLALWLARRRSDVGSGRTRPAWMRWALIGGALVGTVLLGLLATRVAGDVANSYEERLQFWQTALVIFADHPVVGTGLDSFRDHFPTERPAEHAVARGYQITDSTHNTVLGMLSNGGTLLALTYLAFVGYTGWALVRGLRTVPAERLLPLAGFGGMWVAYQAQSMVSVDVPPLAFLHFLSAALVIAAAAPPAVRSWRLPLPAARHNQYLPAAGAPRQGLALAAMAAVALLAVGALWGAFRPFSADLAASGARKATPKQAIAAAERAVELAPWEAEHRMLLAQAHNKAGNDIEAYEAASKAAELRRGSSKLAFGNAALAKKAERPEEAAPWVELALTRDPNNPELIEEAVKFFRDEGDEQRAEELERRAEQLRARYGES